MVLTFYNYDTKAFCSAHGYIIAWAWASLTIVLALTFTRELQTIVPWLVVWEADEDEGGEFDV